MGFPETSVRNYRSTLRKIPEERRSVSKVVYKVRTGVHRRAQNFLLGRVGGVDREAIYNLWLI
jgi:hypothetical protein